MFDVGGLGILEKRLPTTKAEIIERAEQAILSNYLLLAESALKNQQKREDNANRDKSEDAKTRRQSPSSRAGLALHSLLETFVQLLTCILRYFTVPRYSYSSTFD